MAKQEQRMVLSKSRGSVYEFYISGNIRAPEHYIEVFDVIRHAREDEIVKIYLNTYGGDMFSAIQFMRVLADTEATVIASVEGLCMSAGTLILVSADQIEITPHSVFMFHNYSGGSFGKGNEMYSQVAHEKKWSERLLHEAYKDFLSVEEVDQLLAGKDIWMDDVEVTSRMHNLIRLRGAEEALVKDETT